MSDSPFVAGVSDQPGDANRPIGDIAAYANQVLIDLRQAGDAGPEGWREKVERGLREAYKRNDFEGLATMVQTVGGYLDAQQRFEEALWEIEHALTLGQGNANAVAMLGGLRATMLVTRGDLDGALAAVRMAEEALARADSRAAIFRTRVSCATVRCLALVDQDHTAMEDLIGEARRGAPDWSPLFLMSWHIPHLFAMGERARARPWIRELRFESQAAGHRYREADATAFDAADIAVTDATAEPTAAGKVAANWMAARRLSALALRASLLRRDWGAADLALAHIDRAHDHQGPARAAVTAAFRACTSAHAGAGTTPVETSLPGRPQLGDLGATLAGAEALAYGGSQPGAVRWLEWFDHSVPPWVQTSIEWPVSRARLQGLLAARAGDARKARRWLERAVTWADDAGYLVESALARVQLAEVHVHFSLPIRAADFAKLRRDGWATLRRAGVDPAPHAYAVSQSIAAARGLAPLARLTPREAEVLGLLARGLAYKDIAETLGIRFPTAQTLVHRVYDKLGVSGKVQAIVAARDAGIL